ncbi:MAG: hypothetical protein V3R99_04420 [Thermoguttaceae bacterium]
MLQRLMLLGLLCGLMAAATGCGLCHNMIHAPFGPGTICTTGNCGHTCEPAGVSSYGGSCGYCADPGAPCGPLSFVHSLFHAPSWDCGSCGERYWGDFHGDPPECCDPCDRCGNFTGAAMDGCNSCNGGGGYQMEYGGGGGSGCSTCGTQGPASYGPPSYRPPSYGPQMASRIVEPKPVSQVTRTYRPTRR